MNGKAALGYLGAVTAGLIMGLVLGAKGCDDGSVTRLLEENARLKIESEKHRADAFAAESGLAKAQERLAELRAIQVSHEGEIAALRKKVRQANRPRDERNEYIDALEKENVRLKEIDLFHRDALTAAVTRGDHYQLAAEKEKERADMLEDKVLKGRTQKILIGVGSAIGASALTLGAVAAAGRL